MYFKKIALFSAITLSFLSCNKDDQTDTVENYGGFSYNLHSTIDYDAIDVKSRGFTGARSSTQLLVFEDMEHFKATLAELERQVEELDSAFLEYYPDLDGDSLITIEEEIGFNEEDPLYNFGEKLHFHTLHADIATAEEEWLDNEELDEENDPDDYFVFDESVRTLLNADNEVQIGNSIYKLVEEGYFEIVDGDVNSLRVLDPASTSSMRINASTLPENIVFHGESNEGNAKVNLFDDCKGMKRDVYWGYGNRRKIKCVVSHWNNPWGSRRVAAKTKNYRKKKRRWKKYRTTCYAKVYGHISGWGGDCSTMENFNSGNSYARKRRRKKVKHKINVQTKTKSGWVKGWHKGAGSVERNTVLNW